jgi:hypothetical protein
MDYGSDQKEGDGGLAALIVLAFLVLIGPLSFFYAADSRRMSDRGWFGGARD